VDDFPPETLRQYALLADGERGALVGPRGDIAFMCAPRWHDDAVFSSLIGGGGHYAVTPHADRYVWGGYYEEDTLIWRNRWTTTDGTIECRDALAFPGDAHRAVLLRRVEPVGCAAGVDVRLSACARFGQEQALMRQVSDDVWEGRSGPLHIRWSCTPSGMRQHADQLSCLLELAAGDRHDLVLEISDRPLPTERVDPAQTWAATERAWQETVPRLAESIAPHDAQHSYAVMRGLTSSSGGMAAAATMSLPERAAQGRNYDYRYSWIRDQCYAGQAVAAAGGFPLLDDAVRFVADRLLADGPDLKPAYTVDGGPVPDERSLDLEGYPGGFDKVGNWVNQQFQLDAFGESLLLFAAADRHDRLDPQHRQAALTAVDAIKRRWTEPDAGIWELDNRRWAHSRLMCAAGLRSFAATTGTRESARWTDLADTIVADTERDCTHFSGRWQRAPEDTRVDAALLLPAIRGALPADHPRSVATLDAVRRDLGRDGYVYRFRHDDRPLNEAEGAFVLCGFHLAIAEHQRGRQSDALRWFERNRAACGPPGLFTEEFDVVQGQLRGNLPQAFAHALLIESSARLSRSPTPETFEHL